jgi:ABC-type antimicrobial peptide transport system permease subunit
LLSESLFQSELIVSEASFFKLFPRREGFQFTLIDVGDANVDATRQMLQRTLGDAGFDIRSSVERARNYFAVENMYLATFQLLGGLALVLGALGLAIVLLRNIWERRGEMALLRAVGFAGPRIAWMVIVENAVILGWGLLIGLLAALAAVWPHLTASFPWGRVAVLLACVAGVGMLAPVFAIRNTLTMPIVTMLRRE